MDRW